MKNILIILFVLLLLGGAYWFISKDGEVLNTNTEDTNRLGNVEEISEEEAKENAETFSGALELVHTGCFADGECYITVDGKHVTTTMGWSQAVVGTIQGVEGFGDLEGHLGKEVEVYAQKKADGTYTLYGSSDFYVKLK